MSIVKIKLDLALSLHEQGFNIIPLKEKSKIPIDNFRWKKFQFRKQSKDEIKTLFADHGGNIGVICGKISNNLVVLDADDESTFQKLLDIFKDKSIKIVKSNRGGHVYLRSNKTIKSQTINNQFGKIEVRSSGLYVVSEYSFSKEGIQYDLKNHCNNLTIIDINILSGLLDYYLLEENDITSLIKNINKSGLKDKLINNFYKTKSEADMALIIYLVKKNLDDIEIIDKLIKLVNYPSRYINLLAEDSNRAYQWLELSINKAKEQKDNDTFTYNKNNIVELKTILSKSPIKGKSGASFYKVLLCHLEVSESSGSKYHLSIREGIERTGLSTATYQKQNDYLKRLNLITIKDGNKGSKGMNYEVNYEKTRDYLLSLSTHNYYNIDNTTLVNECNTYGYMGIFEQKSFNHSALQIYNAILNKLAFDVSGLIEVTGRSENTIRRVLKNLTEYGILIREGNSYTISSDLSLFEFSFKEGYTDKSDKRKKTHDYERNKRLEYLTNE